MRKKAKPFELARGDMQPHSGLLGSTVKQQLSTKAAREDGPVSKRARSAARAAQRGRKPDLAGVTPKLKGTTHAIQQILGRRP